MATVLNHDRTHRSVLERGAPDAPYVLFIGLNPSTAAEKREDPTTGRLNGFCAAWGYQRWKIINLATLVSSDPKVLRNFNPARSICAQQMLHMRHAIDGAHRVVACWHQVPARAGSEGIARVAGDVLQRSYALLWPHERWPP